MKKYFIIGILVVLVALMAGCESVIDAPSDPSGHTGTLEKITDTFMAAIGDPSSTSYYVYLPPNYDEDRTLGYPVLYLLNGFGGDENYYINYFSILDAVDLLYSRGEIKEMILVLPSGHSALGGSFYTNSGHQAVGMSEQHILDIIEEVDNSYHTSSEPEFRAIGGFSMGGYGAISIVMNDTDNLFGYVSAHAAPLAFWGERSTGSMDANAYTGIEALLPEVLAETGYQAVLDTLPTGDYVSWRNMMFPSPDRVVTSMMFAMSAAFSPANPAAPYIPTVLDSMVVGVEIDTLTGAPVYTRQLIGLNLPIGHNGMIDTTTWNRWLEKDPTSKLLTTGPGGLSNTKIYLHVGNDEPTHGLGLNGAHMVFGSILSSVGIPADSSIFYDGVVDGFGVEIPAGHTDHTFERLKAVIKWHSDQFPN